MIEVKSKKETKQEKTQKALARLEEIEETVRELVAEHNKLSDKVNFNTRIGLITSSIEDEHNYSIEKNDETGKFFVYSDLDGELEEEYDTEDEAKAVIEELESEGSSTSYDQIVSDNGPPYAHVYAADAGHWFPSGINC